MSNINNHIDIKTPQEMANKANKINHNLSHKEMPRITIWAYIWENFRKEFKIIFRI